MKIPSETLKVRSKLRNENMLAVLPLNPYYNRNTLFQEHRHLTKSQYHHEEQGEQKNSQGGGGRLNSWV